MQTFLSYIICPEFMRILLSNSVTVRYTLRSTSVCLERQNVEVDPYITNN